jgi:predicted kinase
MFSNLSTLHLMCGKAASGKSTLATKLSQSPQTVLISEDQWLGPLFGDQMSSLKDYRLASGKLKTAMQPHLIALLQAGLSVVLDFPANTREQRVWMHELTLLAGADHVLQFLDMSDATCLARLHQRNASGSHPFTLSDEQFHQLASYFEPPLPDEGFEIQHYRDSAS